MKEVTKQYKVKELFSCDNYIIPIYQRNYAWRNPEITQLIQDIVDYITKENTTINEKPNYYIGTLIVYERKNGDKTTFETIDGQQRLTTLTILLSLIKNEYPTIDISWFKELNLQFDSRKISTETLQYIFNGLPLDSKDCNFAIKQGYEDSKNSLRKILEEHNLSIVTFCNYLFDKVNILRVLVPIDTDLNHYFEIMNSRGEQLEKHEILKAKCIEILDYEDRYAFNLMWEACSNMEKYVQYGFNTDQRDVIFGKDDKNGDKWNKLISSEELYNNLKTNTKEETQFNPDNKNDLTIEELLRPDTKRFYIQSEQNGDTAERFNSVINFSNFLLHILRIQTKENIALDDKRLLELFNPYLKNSDDKKEFVKNFGYNLLKGKFLFDRNIIKREFTKGTDRWSLKQLKWYEQNRNASYTNTFGSGDNNDDVNREILMLLSMFHVSNPTLVYKHWLNAALKYVFENENVTASSYKQYLEELAKAFLFDRFLASTPKDYFEIIYTNNGQSKNSDIEIKKLNQGTSVENFIFNYLDYILWQLYRNNNKEFFTIEGRIIIDIRIKDFEYTFRSSIEHYYPQNPIEGNPEIIDKWLNYFGNLCLISTSKNSKLSNYMPNAKKDHYYNSPTVDSIKQRIMMEYLDWDTMGDNSINEIEEHGNKMIELIIAKNLG
jgi:hypothetical protein